MNEYQDLVKEALDEIQDLRDAIEFGEDELTEALGFIDSLETELGTLREQLVDGSYQFEDKDLGYMAVVDKQSSHFLPFKDLLETINRTHREGLGPGHD